jgi:hypothetical protein
MMSANRATVLDLLKKELNFLESGGYKRGLRSPWRAAYIFDESPSCPNYDDLARSHPCSTCWLMDFVSPEFRGEQVPCRFVQLTASGLTVDSFYRYASAAETEDALRCWLQTQIQQIESELRDVNGFRRS